MSKRFVKTELGYNNEQTKRETNILNNVDKSLYAINFRQEL